MLIHLSRSKMREWKEQRMAIFFKNQMTQSVFLRVNRRDLLHAFDSFNDEWDRLIDLLSCRVS